MPKDEQTKEAYAAIGPTGGKRGMGEQTKPHEMTLGHKVSALAGILVVAVLNDLGLNLSGPGLEGAIRAGLFYGVGGVGGGLVVYEVVQRFRYRLGRPRQASEQ
jgi:hypothetical protein